MPQAAPLPWDGLTLELWSMLVTGGTVLLLEEVPLTASRLRWAVRQAATLAWATTSIFNLLVEEDIDCFDGLQQVLVGGERLSAEHVRRFLERHRDIRLTNGYGPAEATVFVATHDIRIEDCDSDFGIPLGKGLPDTELLILDGDSPCEEGEIGELCIAGPRLALGYLGDVRGGFEKQPIPTGSRRLYRTGDLVSTQRGLLHFVGRKDRQVKVRGHRVEPQGLEAATMHLAEVQRCTVVPVQREVDGSAIVLFYRTVPGSNLAESYIRDYLRGVLPDYAVPHQVCRVDNFPLTANGKLDEKALLALLLRRPHPSPGLGGEGAAEVTDLERRVAAVLAAVLNVDDVPVDVESHALGATSLDLVRVGMRLERMFGVPVSAAGLHRNADVRAIAAAIARAQSSGETWSSTGAHAQEVAMDPLAASFLVHQELEPDDTSSLCPMLWEIRGPLDVAALRRSIQDLLARHDSLRAAYKVGRQAVAVPGAPASGGSLRVLASAASLADARGNVQAALYSEPMKLQDGEVWRAVLAALVRTAGSQQAHILGIVVHHLAFDGWSEGVLARDLTVAYNARRDGQEPCFEFPAPAMAELAAARRRRKIARDDDSLTYWETRLKGVVGLRFSAGKPAAGRVVPSRARLIRTRELSAKELEQWTTLAASHATTLFAVLLAVYARCLAQHLAEDDVVIGVPVVMRESSLEEAAIGCIINMLCVRLNDVKVSTWDGAVTRAAHEFDSAFAHRHLSFPDLVRHLKPPRTTTTPIYQAICVLQDNDPPHLELEGCVSTFDRLHPPDAAAQLVVEFCPTPEDGMCIELSYQAPHVLPETASRLAEDLMTTLAIGPAAPW
jgi:acyl carrier protein